MGLYLNPKNRGFQVSSQSDIYVDKTELIRYTNYAITQRDKYLCVSRPRRFGKSMAAQMLCAYYSRGCDSRELFQGFKISKDELFLEYLNQYDVIFLDIQLLLGRAKKIENLVPYIEKQVIRELRQEYGQYFQEDEESLSVVLATIYEQKEGERGFIFIVDEWDCIFREAKEKEIYQKEYLDFLKGLWKGQDCIDLVYMTGILPIKKYGTHSALNIFTEYSMIDSDELSEFVGFTQEEVESLCKEYDVDFLKIKKWYDGYVLWNGLHIYNPKSVVEAVRRKRVQSYWVNTETYEALKIYISMNLDGLRDDITKMLGGMSCKVDTRYFQNDMTTLNSKDDIFTLLIHLGYLSYDQECESVFIPNEEVNQEFFKAIVKTGWENIIEIYQDSEKLLKATLEMKNDIVANMIDKVHTKTTSILKYNDENSLSCVITLAYQSAVKDYIMVREFPTGKGYADIMFMPLKHIDAPVIVIELKWNKSAEGAIAQIKNKRYVEGLETYSGEILLVGINYNKETKKHECIIEKIEKNRY